MRTAVCIFVMFVTCAIASASSDNKGTSRSYELSGMNVVLLGDSNTWLSGDSCNNPQGWGYWLREEYSPATCMSYARSGATWTHTEKTTDDIDEYSEVISDNNVITNQVNRLIKAHDEGVQATPDIIIIMAGTNDAWFTIHRPMALKNNDTEMDQQSTLQLAGAVIHDCRLLKETFPNAYILLLTPPLSKQAGEENIHLAGDIISACGKYLNTDVIRLDSSAIDTYDGTHTTVQGAKKIASGLF